MTFSKREWLFQMSSTELCTSLTELHAKSLLNNNDTFLFDCDGVIWNFPDIFPGAIELLNLLKEQVTNTSTLLFILHLESPSGQTCLFRYQQFNQDARWLRQAFQVDRLRSKSSRRPSRTCHFLSPIVSRRSKSYVLPGWQRNIWNPLISKASVTSSACNPWRMN